MKNIFKTFLALASAAALFISCAEEGGPLASSVSVDKAEVVFEGLAPSSQTVTVKADGDWFAFTSYEWITVEPATGSGDTQVTVSVAPNTDSWNELAGPRSGLVSFYYGTTGIAPLTVTQKGENGHDASRQYSLITKAEEMEAGSYLVVFNYSGADNALKAFNATSETYYSYLYGNEVTVEDNVISMPNASNAYVFETAEGGYKIKMGNGRYLFQAESYNNFYSTTDAGKADVWDVTFDEEGFATIKNITVANKWMQWTSYGNAGAYSSAQDGAVLPKLYKDAKPASDEILIVPESFSVIAEATTASIPVQSNKTWKVRCHDEWIKSFTTEGEGDGSIELTFDANSSVEEAKTATIQIIGETVNYNITFVQNKVATTIAEVVAMLTSTDKNNQSAYSVDLTGGDAVVSYVSGNNAFIEDKTGAILLYKSGHGLTAGKKVSGKISGAGYIYNGLPELTSFDGAELADGGTIPCTEMTLPDLIKNYKSNFSRRVLIKGVTVTDAINGSDRDGKIEAGGKNVAVRAQSSSLNMPTGVCDIICFPSIYKTTYQVSLFDNAHCTYSSINSTLSVSDLSVGVGDDASVTLTTNNKEGAVTYSVDNTSIATVSDAGKVTGLAEGEAVLTVKIAAAGIYSAVEAAAKITVTASTLEVITVTMSECFAGATTFVVGNTYKMGDLTCEYVKMGGSAASNYDAGDPGVRFYANDVLKFTSDKDILKMEFVAYGGKTGPITSDVGNVTGLVWTGTAKEITFTASAQCRFNAIKVTFAN